MYLLGYKVIAVDFDGCLCSAAWPGIGEPNAPLICALKDFRKHGHKVILWTCREGKLLEEALAWCDNQGLQFDSVNANLDDMNKVYGNDCRKIGADIYIDDRAVNIAYCPYDESSVNDLIDFVYGD